MAERQRTKSELKRLFTNLKRKVITDNMMSVLIDGLWRRIIQPDWDQTDQYQPDFIKNKPPGIHDPITETPSGAVNGINTTFLLSLMPCPASVRVFLNGVRLMPTGDYTLNGLAIGFVFAPYTGDIITVFYKTVSADTPVAGEVPTGDINGVNSGFTLAYPPADGSVMVFLNGILQIPALSYTLAGKVISFAVAPFTGDIVIVDYKTCATAAGAIFNEVPTGDINGINTNFVLSNVPATAYVWLNGARQKAVTDYTLASDTIIFITAPYTGDIILVDYEY